MSISSILSGRGHNRTYTIIAHQLRRHILLIVILIIAIILGMAVTILSPLLIKRLIDDVVSSTNQMELPLLLGAIVIVPFVSTILGSLQKYYSTNVGVAISDALRKELFRHLIRARMLDIEELATGEIIYRITKVCGELGEVYIAVQLLPVISSVILLTGNVAAMLVLDWRLALVALVAYPPSYIFSNRVKDYAARIDAELHSILGAGMSYLQEVFPGLRIVRSFNGDVYETNRWDNWIEKHLATQAKASTFHNLALYLPTSFINNLVVGIVYGYGAYEITFGHLSVGTLIAFVVYVPVAYKSLQDILTAHISLQEARVAISKIDELFELPQERHIGKGLPLVSTSHIEIEFDRVSFSYGREGFGLKDVSFRVEQGEFLGIVGTSGGGKTTIVDLLMGFYNPSSGTIRINGVDLQELSLGSVRSMIGLVPQDTFVWNASIRDNIIYPRQDVSIEKVMEAAKIAQLHDFICTLSERYDTVIGERGVWLSGGERQRLAICRAVVKDPRILLMDEPTSALDSITELKVRDAIEAAKIGRTAIVVAHRLISVMHADTILVLDQGRVSEMGTPKELISKRGTFYDLYTAQMLGDTTS